MIIVTGGAGFIGSALVWALNARGERDIVIVDALDHDEKEHNVAPLAYERLLGGNEFRQQLAAGEFDRAEVKAVLHMGAISSTTEQDWNKLQDVNVSFTQEIIRWCADHSVRCVYASSGAVYGDGAAGYSDEAALFDRLQPLNLYGKSKLLVDIWARDGGYLKSAVGVRYFNVFGPDEYHKKHMRSVIAKKFDEVQRGEALKLFRSNNVQYKDGEQQRDFLYVKDAAAATSFLLDQPQAAGVFNIGTGRARTWNDVAHGLFGALRRQPCIEYIDLPADLKDQYQNFTQADITRLRAAGWRQKMTSLEDAVTEYVQQYLIPHRHLGEYTAF
ncbi:MAG: ADP-glyceromanno-heptose 6-epimerase [Candidatus Andersenbacteria bacterium]|nr:ADP-glyceromanno-heptose 6-epimerase [Candidatus Andersenbacteria bacterium]